MRELVYNEMIPVVVNVTKAPHHFKLYSVGYFPDDVIRNIDGTFVLSREVLGNPSLRDFVEFALQLHREGRRYRHSIGNPDSRCFYQGINDDSLIQLSGNVNQIKEMIVELLLNHFDRLNGGFGTAPKYLNSKILEALFYLYHRSADEILLYQVILKTLSSVYLGLVDSKDHGFVRCTYRADWGNPSLEKLLISQVEGIRTFTTAYQITGNNAYLVAAKKTLSFVFNFLYSAKERYFQAAVTSVHPQAKVPTLKTQESGEGVFFPSHDPLIDSTHVISWNLQMIRCLFMLGQVSDEEKELVVQSPCELLDCYVAMHQKEGLLSHIYQEDLGYFLLEDQVSFLEACKDAHDVTLKESYLDAAHSMINLLYEVAYDSETRLFRPILYDDVEKKLLHKDWHSMEWNARLAILLSYFSEIFKIRSTNGEKSLINGQDLRRLADDIVSSLKYKYRCFDPSLASYFFAIQHFLREEIKIYLIGETTNPKFRDFHGLILKKYEPMRILVHVPLQLLDSESFLLPRIRAIDKEPAMVYFQYQDVQSPPITTLRQLEVGLERIGMV